MEWNNILFEYSLIIPILYLFFFICYRKLYVSFMNSILGRFINFVLIVIHSIKSSIYGLFTCSVLIYFYQMESTIWLNEGFFECNCALNNNANMKELLLYDTNITPIIYVNKQIEFNNQIQNDYIKKL